MQKAGAMGTDYKVAFRSDDTVAELARRVRLGVRVDQFCQFNIVDAIESLEGIEFKGSGKLQIRLFDEDEDDPAYVTFSPLTLHAHREIWQDAKLGEPKARYILAHELGHIVMHRHNRQAFSEDPRFKLKFPLPQESAEAQANLFASHFLAPDHLARKCANSVELSLMFDYPGDFADSRMNALEKRTRFYLGEPCGECGNFTLLRGRMGLRCDNCGAVEDACSRSNRNEHLVDRI